MLNILSVCFLASKLIKYLKRNVTIYTVPTRIVMLYVPIFIQLVSGVDDISVISIQVHIYHKILYIYLTGKSNSFTEKIILCQHFQPYRDIYVYE